MTQSSTAPREWAVKTAANEIAILRHRDSYLRYKMHVLDSKGDQTRDVIESRDGTVARLVERNSKPLTEDEAAAERSRLNDLLASPDTFFKHIRNEDTGKKLAEDMILLMPDAMSYTFVPGQPPSSAGRSGEVVLDFRPNPAWSPPTTTSAALTGLEGRMWIDPKSAQMVRMEGHIFKPVNFGFGVLAHVYPGGTLLLEQVDAGGSRWILNHFAQQVSVRALMVKRIDVHETVDVFEYHTVTPMSYREAIRMLLAQ